MKVCVLAVALAFAVAACGPTLRGAKSRRGVPEGAPDAALGAHAKLYTTSNQLLRGELIGCDLDEVFLHVNEEGNAAWVRVPWSEIERLEIRRGGSTGGLGLWVLVGTVSTISHGVFLVISAPIWLLAGVTAAVHESRGGRNLEVYDSSCDEARPYARFPLGLPEGFETRFVGP